MWYQERKNKFRNVANPKFSMCYGEGKVQLPLLKIPPKVLHEPLFNNEKTKSIKL